MPIIDNDRLGRTIVRIGRALAIAAASAAVIAAVLLTVIILLR